MRRLVGLCMLALLLANAYGQTDQPVTELEKLKASYQKSLSLLGADYSNQLGQMNQKYVVILDNLMKRTTQKGDLDGALAVKIEKDSLGLTKPHSQDMLNRSAWTVPYGGSFTCAENVCTLTGPGTMAANGAIAILEQSLQTDCTIEGEVLLSGDYAGFVLGYNAKSKQFVSLYSLQGPETDYWVHQGQSRSKLATLPLPWPRETWVSFTITRHQQEVSLAVGSYRTSCRLPDEANGPFGGLIVYHNARIQLRDLTILSLGQIATQAQNGQSSQNSYLPDRSASYRGYMFQWGGNHTLVIKDEKTITHIAGQQTYDNSWRLISSNVIEWNSGANTHTITIEGSRFNGIRLEDGLNFSGSVVRQGVHDMDR